MLVGHGSRRTESGTPLPPPCPCFQRGLWGCTMDRNTALQFETLVWRRFSAESGITELNPLLIRRHSRAALLRMIGAIRKADERIDFTLRYFGTGYNRVPTPEANPVVLGWRDADVTVRDFLRGRKWSSDRGHEGETLQAIRRSVREDFLGVIYPAFELATNNERWRMIVADTVDELREIDRLLKQHRFQGPPRITLFEAFQKLVADGGVERTVDGYNVTTWTERGIVRLLYLAFPVTDGAPRGFWQKIARYVTFKGVHTTGDTLSVQKAPSHKQRSATDLPAILAVIRR